MNRFYSRLCEERVEKALEVMPVVVVTGARQTGKTTLVRELLSRGKRRKYYSLDQLDVLAQAREQPDSLLEELPVTIDEVQRAPELLLAVKKKVDSERVKGGILLTGSANLALMHTVSDSLAGRASYVELPPFCPLEWKAAKLDLLEGLFEKKMDMGVWGSAKSGSWFNWGLRGGYPSAIELERDADRQIWFAGYVQTYLERDLRQLSEVSSLIDFQRLMNLAANRVGKVLNESELARDAGLSQPTCHRYLNLLETGYQIGRIHNYASNPTKSAIKGKKLFWTDVGLAMYLARIYDRGALENRLDIGFWFEQSVYQSLQSWRSLGFNRNIFYWRDASNHEVDFILQKDDELVGIEVKLSEGVFPVDLKGLKMFQEKFSTTQKKVRGIFLHLGKEARVLGDNMYALPVERLFP